MNDHKSAYQSLPGIDRVLASAPMQPLIAAHGSTLIKHCIRQAINHFRDLIVQTEAAPSPKEITDHIIQLVHLQANRHLKPMINATGIIIHTNLGRAPFGHQMVKETTEVLTGYNNLEFDLDTAGRGHRNNHARNLLKFLTGAEEILIVNNTAAAVMLVLRSFARNKEVLVSRGELIEIGGSFRIPDIMAASDCKMVEVGTTNKTRLSDYKNAINENTALLFKAHKSNYVIKGFTEEVSAHALATLGQEHQIPVLYDLGSGLLRKIAHPALQNEPDVREALATGADLVCFSGDKLLGGPQAGIIVGKKALIDQLMEEPLLRALRVCKTTLAFLETACSYYLNDDTLFSKNMVFKALTREKKDIQQAAERMKGLLSEHQIKSEVIPSVGQCGGGSLPDAGIDSFAVQIIPNTHTSDPSLYPGRMYRQLLKEEIPILGILRKGHLLLDVLMMEDEELKITARAMAAAHDKVERG